MSTPRGTRTVACPVCGKNAIYSPSNPYRPFCSERCRVTDLGAWASEAYRIPEETAPEDEDGDKGGSDENETQKP